MNCANKMITFVVVVVAVVVVACWSSSFYYLSFINNIIFERQHSTAHTRQSENITLNVFTALANNHTIFNLHTYNWIFANASSTARSRRPNAFSHIANGLHSTDVCAQFIRSTVARTSLLHSLRLNCAHTVCAQIAAATTLTDLSTWHAR